MIPRFSITRWGGGDPDYRGWSIDIEWLGLIMEINVGLASDSRLHHNWPAYLAAAILLGSWAWSLLWVWNSL